EALDGVVAGRDDLAPLLAGGIVQIDGEEAPVRRLPVGLYDQAVAREPGLELGIDPSHDRADPAVGVEVLDEHLGPGPAGAGGEEQVTPIFRDGHADPL